MNQKADGKLNIPTWLSLEEACKILSLKAKTVKNKCRNAELTYKVVRNGKQLEYYISSTSIPENLLNLYFTKKTAEFETYGDVPQWSKAQAEKYLTIISACSGLRGQKLKDYINAWNRVNPDFKTSYSRFMYMKKRYLSYGFNGLLAQYGHKNCRVQIPDIYYQYFKNIYLVEGAPSLQSCWEQTFGFARKNEDVNKETFPSGITFKRKLKEEMPEQSIYLARYGYAAWNTRYGNFIDRDYDNIICGKVWVSDHAQIDVACLSPEGDVIFPWVTAWRDYKSGKWLGWLLQYGHPNSDHIFQTFYYAAKGYGLPDSVIIDNGKDYRSKDFAGGRSVMSVDKTQVKTRSMLAELDVRVHFALPYNAQTKPIERDFLKIKELLSKHSVGYRGGNVVERPEKLLGEIKAGKIMPFEKFKTIFDDFIVNILNKRPSTGKNLQGMSPDELFNREFTEKRVASNDALKLFCMRTSRTFTIGRNGIKDNQLGITYWSDWMISKTSLKVYLRRDIENYKEAWVFRADNDEFVGKTTAVRAVAALYANEVSKEEFKEAMANKKRNYKIAKAYIKQIKQIPLEEQCENYKAAYASVEKEAKPKITKFANTNMDKVIRKNKEMEAFGQYDLSIFLNEEKKEEKPLYLYETDKILAERAKGVANGY